MASQYIRQIVREIPSYTPSVLLERARVSAKLNSNENPLPPSRQVIECLTKALPTVNRYPRDPVSLCAKIASYASLKPDNVLIGNGSDELIDIAIKAFINPSEEVVISIPTFQMYEFFTKIANGKVKLIKMGGDFRWDIQGILKAISNKTKIVFFCSPNNPTGNTVPENDVLKVVERGVVVVLDEAYFEFSGRSLSHLIRKYDNVVVFRTFSKIFGLAGLRIGYILSNPELIDSMKHVTPPFPVNVLALKAAEAAIEDTKYIKKVRALVNAGKNYLYSELNKIREVRAYPSETNFILIDIRKTGINSTKIFEALLRQGVLIRDCSSFRGLERNFIRVTVGAMNENEQFIKALKNILKRRKVK
jgi:histidinol-phosphate aminotransferase